MLRVLSRTTLAVAFSTMLPLAALAAPIKITYEGFDVGDSQGQFQAELDTFSVFSLTEDFETFTVGQSNFSGKAISTKVGTMTFSGDPGSGGAAEDNKSFGRIATGNVFGRQNTSLKTFTSEGITTVDSNGNPIVHNKFLESNDVQTMTWVAKDTIGPDRQFNRLLFTITDAADTGAKFRVSDQNDNSVFFDLSSRPRSEIINFRIDFTTMQSMATIEFTNMNGGTTDNDGVGFDSMTVAAVPLPAAAWLLLGVSGALVAAKRRSARRAA